MIIGSHVLKMYLIGYRNLSSKRDTFFGICRDREQFGRRCKRVTVWHPARERAVRCSQGTPVYLLPPPTWLRPNRASKPSSLCMED